MSDKLITIEDQDGPFQVVFQRILRMVPDRDKNDKNLHFLKDDLIQKECGTEEEEPDPEPPSAA